MVVNCSMSQKYEYTIKDLDQLIKFDGEVKNVEISRLTAPGENFISIVLRVDIQVEKNGKIETIKAIAKKLPLKDTGMMEFNSTAMKSEIRWYSEFLPLFEEFAKEWSVNTDFFPKYLGSRLNSSEPPNKELDKEAVLVLENLIPQGYKNIDRYIGFNFDETKAILKSLAQFHAIPLIMKFKDPEKFQYVKSFIEKNKTMHPDPELEGENKIELNKDINMLQVLIDQMLTFSELKRYNANIKNMAGHFKHPPMNNTVSIKEPWTTIVHNDCWVNNVMLKTEDGIPFIKLVDYQMCNFGSFIGDVTFFLLTSVQDQVLRTHLDELLKFYYDELTAILENATIPELTLSYEDYLSLIEFAMREKQIGTVMFFCHIIFGNKDNVPDILTGEITAEDYLKICVQNMSQRKKEKIILIVELAIQRGWM